MSNSGGDNFLDLSKLSDSSIRKYHSYYGLGSSDKDIKEQVKTHYEEILKVEHNEVIDRYLELKREDKEKKAGRHRAARFNN